MTTTRFTHVSVHDLDESARFYRDLVEVNHPEASGTDHAAVDEVERCPWRPKQARRINCTYS
jgi:hypothetical protein